MKEIISDKKLLNLTYKFIYEDNSFKGLAIGNYTSQYFANIYLKLELNKKSCYYINKFVIDFCGYVIFEDYILIRKRIKNNIKRCFKRWNKLLNNNNLDINKVNKSIKSYLSCLSHCNSYNYINKYIKINYNRLIFKKNRL